MCVYGIKINSIEDSTSELYTHQIKRMLTQQFRRYSTFLTLFVFHHQLHHIRTHNILNITYCECDFYVFKKTRYIVGYKLYLEDLAESRKVPRRINFAMRVLEGDLFAI